MVGLTAVVRELGLAEVLVGLLLEVFSGGVGVDFDSCNPHLKVVSAKLVC